MYTVLSWLGSDGIVSHRMYWSRGISPEYAHDRSREAFLEYAHRHSLPHQPKADDISVKVEGI